MISAIKAIERLREGNHRFVSDNQDRNVHINQARRNEVCNGQQPFAIILGCSDSRVPAEIIFDQGLGDLFTVRVAGNIVTPSQLGSIEFAAMQFGTPLIVVLGHSKCGAILATLEEIEQPDVIPSPHLRSIIEHIRPPIETLLDTEHFDDFDTLVQQAVRTNIIASVNQILANSPLLAQLTFNDALMIVAAEYSLETGEVEWFD